MALVAGLWLGGAGITHAKKTELASQLALATGFLGTLVNNCREFPGRGLGRFGKPAYGLVG